MINEFKLKHYLIQMLEDYFQDYKIIYGFYLKDGEIKVLKLPKKTKDNRTLILQMPQGIKLKPKRVCSFSEVPGFNFLYKDEIYTFDKLADSIESYITNHINDSGLLTKEEVESFNYSLEKVIKIIKNEGFEFKLQTNYYKSPSTALTAI